MTKSRRIPAGTSPDRALKDAMNGFAAAVVRLPDVDPVTTEVVRIRCADHHDCHT